MKFQPSSHVLWVIVSTALLFSNFARAQITPTAGSFETGTGMGGTTFTNAGGLVTIPASSGKLVGGNLLHSFDTFSVDGTTITGAKFTDAGLMGVQAQSITNVVARVTGSSASTINGSLSTQSVAGLFSPSVNLFLINPQGVIFGPNASISVPGNFVSSTANYVVLGDNTGVFYSDPTAGQDAGLTMATGGVTAFGFFAGTTPKPINVTTPSLSNAGGLQFVGGNFNLAPGTGGTATSLSTTSSVLSIYSIGTAGTGNNASGAQNTAKDSAVPYLTGGLTKYVPGSAVTQVQNTTSFGNVTFGTSAAGTVDGTTFAKGSATATASGAGGHVVIRGGVMVVQNQATPAAATIATTGGSDITIEAQTLSLVGNSSITSTATGATTGGDINVTTDQTTVKSLSLGAATGGSGQIQALVTSGTAGNVNVDAAGPVALVNGSVISSAGGAVKMGANTPLGALSLDGTSSISNTGSGTIAITAATTGTITDNGQISTVSGQLGIDAASMLTLASGSNNIASSGGSILLGSGTPLGGLSLANGTSIATTGTGAVNITTSNTATVMDNGSISTATGDIAIDAASMVTLGGSGNNLKSTGGNINLGGGTAIGGLTLGNGTLIATTTGSGTVTITTTASGGVTDRASITAPGNVSVTAGTGGVDITTNGSLSSTGAGVAIMSDGTVTVNGTVSAAGGALTIDSASDGNPVALSLNGGTITSTGSDISLGLVHPLASVTLNSPSSSITETGGSTLMQSLSINTTGAIDLSAGGTISTATSGAAGDDLNLTTTGSGAITLNNGAIISTTTSGANPGGALTIKATGPISLAGTSFIKTTTTKTGNNDGVAGVLSIVDLNSAISISSHSQIVSETTGGGDAGDITINDPNNQSLVMPSSANTVTITGTGSASLDTGIFSLSKESSSAGSGDAGSVSVGAGGNLNLSGGGQIASVGASTHSGAAGNVLVVGYNLSTIDIGGTGPIIYSQAINPASGGGSVTIDGLFGTAQNTFANITLESGAIVETVSNDQLQNDDGSSPVDLTVNGFVVTLNANAKIQSTLTQLSTDTVTDAQTGGVYVNAFELSVAAGAEIQTTAVTAGVSGDGLGAVDVNTDLLTIAGATITAVGTQFSKPQYDPEIRTNNPTFIADGLGSPDNTSVFQFATGSNPTQIPSPENGIILASGVGQLGNISGVVTAKRVNNGYTYAIGTGTTTGAGVLVNGSDLYYSFSSFSLGTSPDMNNPFINETAIFNVPSSVQNIVARVIGSAAQINGKIQVKGSTQANLFLIDPSGIMIGQGSSYKGAGGLTLSTANSVTLGGMTTTGVFNASPDGQADFSATDANITTTNANFAGPVTAYGFNGTSGNITFNTLTGFSVVGQLQVISGGDINVMNSTISAESNQILFFAGGSLLDPNTPAMLTFTGDPSVGALASLITQPAPGAAPAPLVNSFTTSGFSSLGAITLDNSTLAATSSDQGKSSTVYIRGGSYTQESSLLINESTATSTSSSAGDVVINVDGAAIIDRNPAAGSGSSSINASTFGNVSGGTVEIDAATLTIAGLSDDGIFSSAEPATFFNPATGKTAAFTYTTNPTGSGGLINLFLTQGLSMSGSSEISASTNGPGGGGTITIQGPTSTGVQPIVDLEAQALITSSASLDFSNPAFTTTGNAGNVSVTASELTLENIGGTISPEISTDTQTNGNAGVITIHVDGTMGPGNGDITLLDGGLVSSSSSSTGMGGVINVTQGTSPDGFVIESNTQSNGSDFTGLVAFLEGSGNSAGAGSSSGSSAVFGITVDTASALQISGGAQISTIGEGGGAAGNISIQTHSQTLTVDGEGANFASQISSATTAAGNAGDIVLHTGTTRLTNGGEITSASYQQETAGVGAIVGGGGSVYLMAGSVEVTGFNTDSTILIPGVPTSGNSQITAGTNTTGDGGNVTLNVSGGLMVEDGGLITAATSGSGAAGSVTIGAQTLTVTGINAASNVASQISSATSLSGAASAGGQGGDVNLAINGTLTVENGGQISVTSSNAGNGGNILIGQISIPDPTSGPPTIYGAPTLVDINGMGLNTTGLFAEEKGSGSSDAYNTTNNAISLTTGVLTMENGGQINSGTSAQGNSGPILITTTSVGTIASPSFLVTGATTQIASATTNTSMVDPTTQSNGGDVTIVINGQGTITSQAEINAGTSGTGDGGSVTFTVTGDLAITQGAKVTASSATTSSGLSGQIQINQTVSSDFGTNVDAGVWVDGMGSSILTTAGAHGTYNATANAGNLTINAQALTVSNGAVIDSSTSGSYKAGDIFITAPVAGAQPLTGQFVLVESGGLISSDTTGTNSGGTIMISAGALTVNGSGSAITTVAAGGSGNGGTISIATTTGQGDATGNIHVTNGASISASSVTAGQAGTVSVTQANDITVDGQGSTIATNAGPEGTGHIPGAPLTGADLDAYLAPFRGDINLSSQNLTVSNGAVISATTGGMVRNMAGPGLSPGGAITLHVPYTLSLLNGGTIDASSTSLASVDPSEGVGGSITIGGPIGSGLTALPDANSPITLNVLNGSKITAGSKNTTGGEITIYTTTANIQHGSAIETEGDGLTNNGGSILINAFTTFYLNDYSDISTHSGGVGGNITIDPEFVVINNHSFIDAFGGSGDGNVIILSGFSLLSNSSITATGTIDIAAFPLDLSGSLVGLPADLTDDAKRLRESCARAVNHEFSSLIVVGRSGTETAPDELNSDSGSTDNDGGAEPASAVRAQKKLR